MNVLNRTYRRSGITLTEILISILIMGVGMVSIATLFPIGLKRLREATNDSRSTLLAESALAEIQARNLLADSSFSGFANNQASWYPWADVSAANGQHPMVKDRGLSNDAAPGVSSFLYSNGVPKPPGPGLPFAYDPLWWSLNDYNSFAVPVVPADEIKPSDQSLTEPYFYHELARFGRGIGALRDNPRGAANPSAHGLQRLTNFYRYIPSAGLGWASTYTMPTSFYPAGVNPAEVQAEVAGDVFTSIDDVVMQTEGNAGSSTSPLLPENTTTAGFATARDYTYQWSLTARQLAAGESSAYEADIVVHCQRPVGLDANSGVATGERVVEAVWAHTGSALGIDTEGYSLADAQAVLLRWPIATPDPIVRAGNWICDVTYERTAALDDERFGIGSNNEPEYPGIIARYPGQRAHWYRIIQVGRAEPDPAFPDHRRQAIRVETPVRSRTRLYVDGGNVVPVHVEAALIVPYVVNVFPTVIYSR